MKHPRVYTRGILHFFGGIRQSTLLRSSSFKASALRIHLRAYALGYSAKADNPTHLKPVRTK